MAAMLVELTREANEEPFVIVHQHGGNDVTCKSRIRVIYNVSKARSSSPSGSSIV